MISTRIFIQETRNCFLGHIPKIASAEHSPREYTSSILPSASADIMDIFVFENKESGYSLLGRNEFETEIEVNSGMNRDGITVKSVLEPIETESNRIPTQVERVIKVTSKWIRE